MGITSVKRNDANISTYLKDSKKLKGIDENGDWALSNCEKRLCTLCIKISLTSEITFVETKGTTESFLSVTVKLFEVDGRKDSLSVESQVTGENLHRTRGNATLKVISQLYQSGIIEGDSNFRTKIA